MRSQIKVLSTVAILLLAATQVAVAQNLEAVTLQNVDYAGNGCPEGSAEFILSSDKKSASVIFDEYIAEAGGPGQRTHARKKCDIAFGLKIPNGLKVALITADYRGFTDLPRRARATLTRDYFFAGTRGPRLKKSWKGPRSGYTADIDRMIMSRVYSRCGADVILRSKTAATVRTRRGQGAKMMLVDPKALPSPPTIHYNFSWKKC